MRRIAVVLSLTLPCSPSHAAAVCGAGAARVMVIPSVHRLLNTNPNYSYTKLYDLVAAFHPDIVGIEIRQEDLGRPEPYLQSNYPREMIDLFHRYRDRVFGFDWLGDELSGIRCRMTGGQDKAASSNSNAPGPRRRRHRTAGWSSSRMISKRSPIAATPLESTASPEALANGPYDEITADYYKTVAALTRDTPYALLPTWYASRDRHLADNVTAQIRLHPGCRIAIVTGADHHGPVMAAIATVPTEAIAVKLP